jgi:uncharacterized protein
MKSIHRKIADIDWQRVAEEINEKGYATESQFSPAQSCEELIGKYSDSNLYRKTITMERYHFGLEEYKYFKYPLPDLIQAVRKEVYPKTCTYCKYMDEDVKYRKTISRYI